MSRRSKSAPSLEDLRHPQAKRKNNPPASMAASESLKGAKGPQTYKYDPHLDPQLIWAGKEERSEFRVEALPLHVHEYIAPKAILRSLQRPDPPQLDLFGEEPLPWSQRVEYYQHDVHWTNRLILGDSLLVMNSLLTYEGLAGKVQMIYIDPPYGIKFSSNFQPRIDRRDDELTHEPEPIQAYRDTWHLGIHSYLTYLRDRLLLARELLAESGSLFVQIGDENLHLVRCLLDEVFGRENFVSIVTFAKTSGQSSRLLASINDYLIWYAKNKDKAKFRPLYWRKEQGSGYEAYRYVELADGFRTRNSSIDGGVGKANGKVFRLSAMTSQGYSAPTHFGWEFEGKLYKPQTNRHWTTSKEGLSRLSHAERILGSGSSINYIRYLEDFPYFRISNTWPDVGSVSSEILYVVQTATKVIERCILMTTDPGDLVLDPTCGSGTTAYCAEKWGRRWITCDTSRVAIAIARQRLMTAKFEYYELRDEAQGPAGGFVYETVPHITLESIAKNTEIDEIAARYQPEIAAALAELNAALKVSWQEWEVPREVPHPLWPARAVEAYQRLLAADGLSSAEIERDLALIYELTGHRWKTLKEVPEPFPKPDWPEAAQRAFRRFWELRRAKRKEIEASIQKRAPQEPLYDRPRVRSGTVRVSGPFTVEAIPQPVVEDPTAFRLPNHSENYIEMLVKSLEKTRSVPFPKGKRLELTEVSPIRLGYLHARAKAERPEGPLHIAISFGPLHGPFPPIQLVEAAQTARANGYHMLLCAGFAFDPETQALLDKLPIQGVKVHLMYITPDVLVGDLLKTTRTSQIFSVFGQPDVRVHDQKDGTFTVELLGVDIYDPHTGKTESEPGKNVAAWFLDTDYDGQTFHVCQAFFPGAPQAWEKLQRALKAELNPELFEKLSGTVSLPFKPGEHRRIAVKVIDFRGNEVMRVLQI